MLPVVRSAGRVNGEIALYTVLTVAASLAAWPLGLGPIYGVTAIVPGALFLAAVAALPAILFARTHQNFYFGGTSILIVIGVALETMKQLGAQLMMRSYEGFLK